MSSNPLRQLSFTFLIVMGVLLTCLAYWAALLDWVQAYRTGMDEPHEALFKIAAHLLYLYAAGRFLRSRIRLF